MRASTTKKSPERWLRADVGAYESGQMSKLSANRDHLVAGAFGFAGGVVAAGFFAGALAFCVLGTG